MRTLAKHNIFKIFCALLVFVVDVRVKAGSAIQVPRNCLKSESGCAIQAQNYIEKIETVAAELKFTMGTSVVRQSDNEFQILRGVLHVYAKESVTIHTLFGDLTLTSGDVLIEAQDLKVKFTNLSSDLRYHPRGEKLAEKSAAYDLPAGFSTYFAKITSSGVAETGYPHPAEIEPLIKVWSKTYTAKDQKLFKDKLKGFMLSWKKATETVGPWYVDTVKREIASQEAEEAKQAKLRFERDREDRELRELFRRRNMM